MPVASPPGCPGAAQQRAAGGGEAAAGGACLEQPDGDAACQTAVGQLTYRRAVSKRLVFYDLLCSSPKNEQGQLWMEAVVKLGTYSDSLEELAELRSRLKLGDVVRVQGRPSGRHELQATAIWMEQPWRDSHPGQTFRPQPSPLHGSAAAAAQQQRRRQQQQQQGLQPPDTCSSQQLLGCHADPAIAAALEATGGSMGVRGEAGADVAGVAAAGAGVAAAGAGVAAAGAAAPAAPLCKYFVNTGACAKGTACRFAHARTGALRQQWVADMRRERLMLSASHGFAHSGGAAAKRRRAQLLAAWLVQTYGREALSSGGGVLDVAGGAGGVTFELRHVHGVRCTLVDPRPLKLNKPQLRQLQAAGRAAHVCTLTAAQLQQEAEQGPAAAQYVPLCDQGSAGVGSEAAEGSAAEPLDFLQVRELFGPELWRSPGWRSRFCRGFSLVLACHPDQATEPALEYALEQRLPFAIVPCCVFPRLFPHRRLVRGSGTAGSCGGDCGDSSHGVPVLSYADLVEYIAARGQAQQAVLGFEGANIVLYRGAPATVATAAKASAEAAGSTLPL